MAARSKDKHAALLLTVGLLSWLVPGAGYYVLKEKKRAIIVFVTIALTFCTGLYIGSIAVVNPKTSTLAYVAQIMNSPMVRFLGNSTIHGGYKVYGKPNEVGQIYTSISGLLNLLCIVNAVYLAHLRRTETAGD